LRVNGATYQLLLVERPIDLLGSMAPRPRPPWARLLEHNFPHSRFLSAQAAEGLHATLARLGIAGGAVYDALVAAAAAEHGITLATRDRRAAETYRVLNVEFELIT
jgi:hypothetical protein